MNTMNHRPLNLLSAAVLGLALSLPATASATDISQISASEFYGATYYRNAQDHPQIAKLKSEQKKLNAVARDIGWKANKLKAAIRKVDELSGDPAELAVKAIKAAFRDTRVNGRVLDVLINTEEPKHVVVYVRWQGSKQQDAVKEAATIANIVATKAPLVSTLSLSAIHPRAAKDSKESVWAAKIGRASMERIQPKRINDYADRLYKPLFEGLEERPF